VRDDVAGARLTPLTDVLVGAAHSCSPLAGAMSLARSGVLSLLSALLLLAALLPAVRAGESRARAAQQIADAHGACGARSP
jgi:hypothetical protein